MKDLVSRELEGKETLNFDEFFSIEKEVLIVQILKNPEL